MLTMKKDDEIKYLIHDDRPFYPEEEVVKGNTRELTEEEKKEFEELKKRYGIK